MTETIKIRFKEILNKIRIEKPWDNLIILILNILIAIPLFIIIHQSIVDPNWSFHIDRILLFIIIIIIIQLLLRFLRTFIIFCVLIYVIILLYGTLLGNYGFSDVYEDYRSMIYNMADDSNPQDIIISKLLPFPNKYKIIDAVEFENPGVRNFALMATTKYFKDMKGYNEYRRMIQSFAIFKEIRNNWNYVNDPKGREYIARASESLVHLSGDCDDHAIFMAACIKSIGGTPRIIHTGGHMYPEMLIGNKANLEAANYLIKEVLFIKESKGKGIHYHIDERGQIWLNLDYTAKYPGGPFMSEEILGALTLN